MGKKGPTRTLHTQGHILDVDDKGPAGHLASVLSNREHAPGLPNYYSPWTNRGPRPSLRTLRHTLPPPPFLSQDSTSPVGLLSHIPTNTGLGVTGNITKGKEESPGVDERVVHGTERRVKRTRRVRLTSSAGDERRVMRSCLLRSSVSMTRHTLPGCVPRVLFENTQSGGREVEIYPGPPVCLRVCPSSHGTTAPTPLLPSRLSPEFTP